MLDLKKEVVKIHLGILSFTTNRPLKGVSGWLWPAVNEKRF